MATSTLNAIRSLARHPCCMPTPADAMTTGPGHRLLKIVRLVHKINNTGDPAPR